MQYYLDGYNLLFCIYGRKEACKNLEKARQEFIQYFNRAAQQLRLTLVIVFDGADECFRFTRTHFQSIEVVYTSQGFSADSFFIDMLQQERSASLCTIVSNDRSLQHKCRLQGAFIQSVEEFSTWIKNRLSKIHRKQLRNHLIDSASAIEHTSHVLYYQKIFEERLQNETGKLSQTPLDPYCTIKASVVQKKISAEDQRWLNLFESSASPLNKDLNLFKF